MLMYILYEVDEKFQSNELLDELLHMPDLSLQRAVVDHQLR
jgi:hypothetical protein